MQHDADPETHEQGGGRRQPGGPTVGESGGEDRAGQSGHRAHSEVRAAAEHH